MDALAVIAASDRGALAPLAARPLLAHAISVARQARAIARIAVVTALPEAVRLAEKLGCDVVAPDAAATGSAATAVRLALAALAGRDGYAPPLVCLLDPRCPLRDAQHVDDALDLLVRCGADTLLSVHAVDAPLWSEDEGGRPRPLDSAPSARRFAENGAIVAARTAVLAAAAALPAGRTVLFPMPALAGFTVRSADDEPAAEALLRLVRRQRASMLLRDVKLLALDFDGVLTDNRVLVLEDGREGVLCSRGDGFGFDLLRAIGFPAVVISKEGNPVVGARCKKLKLPCAQGIGDKLPVLERFAREHGLGLDRVAFMGNDLNDLECLRACRLAIAPADAQPEILQIAGLITAAPGGYGAVREICDAIVRAHTAAAVEG
jgi:N-acylneuraminate cytidylyltransferase